jgi:histidinol phosphatase-like PHP family hydrolase
LTVENLVALAKQRGLAGFAITDHTSHLYFPTPEAWHYKYMVNTARWEEMRAEGDRRVVAYIANVRRFRDDGVRVGVEIEPTMKGGLLLSPAFLPRFDVVLAGVHWLPGLEKADEKTFVRAFLDCTLGLLEQPIDILTHPTRIFRRAKRPVPRETYDPITRAAAERGVAIEINNHSQSDPDAEFVKMAIDRGIKIAMSTDTHRIDELGLFDYQKRLLKEIGLTDERIREIALSAEDLPRPERKRIIEVTADQAPGHSHEIRNPKFEARNKFK